MTDEEKFEGPEKLSLVVFSGDFEKVHYAFAMASAALAINVPVTLFFYHGSLAGPGGGG